MDKPVFDFVEKGWGIPINGKSPTLGKYVCIGAGKPVGLETADPRQILLDFTGTSGTASSLYYSVAFQLPKWGYHLVKPEEWIEVSPTHVGYYQKTVAQKKQLEATIKEGLASAASSVADYELVFHDYRKYRNILDNFNEENEHSLKAMFIDKVDIHTGEGFSLFSMPKRWPTIIADFMKLDDDDTEPDKVSKKLSISQAESVVLVTKNNLYSQWKKTFLKAVMGRFATLEGMLRAREKSIVEYKEWLKPYISRFKMTRLGSETASGRSSVMKSYADISGQATFSNKIRLWAWKPLPSKEFRKPTIERKKGFAINLYDSYVRENMILSTKTGLAKEYDWLLDERKYCASCKIYVESGMKCPKCETMRLEKRTKADQIVEDEIIPKWKRREDRLDPDEPYYNFFDIQVLRVGSSLPIGEIEDIEFHIRTFVVSQNVLLVKMLELFCREHEIEKYMDEILGIKIGESNIEEIVKQRYPKLYKEEEKENLWDGFRKELFESLEKLIPKGGGYSGLGMPFFKPGPYESHLSDRIKKHYLKPSGLMFGELTGFIKSGMGVG